MLATRARVASHPLAQFLGLMGRGVAPDEALGLPGCLAVHTLFVRAPLDVAFCDRAGRVLRLAAGVRPFRLGPWQRGAAIVWEMRAGGLSPHVHPGDQLVVEGG